MEGCACELLGAPASGEFLTQLARGADVGWAADSAARRQADWTRAELIALLGSAEAAHELLRAMTRDGRLYPGLAPRVPAGARVVNSELGQLSPPEEYQEALRMSSSR